jgi:hypothetical protein
MDEVEVRVDLTGAIDGEAYPGAVAPEAASSGRSRNEEVNEAEVTEAAVESSSQSGPEEAKLFFVSGEPGRRVL